MLRGAVAGALCLAAGAAEAQRALTVVTTDSTIDAPPSFAAGLVLVRFSSNGSTRRELVVRRVPAGSTAQEVVRGAAGRSATWFDQGSLGGPAPGDSATDAAVTAELRPGRYVLVSYEVDPSARSPGGRVLWREASAVPTSVLISGRFPTPDATVRIRDTAIDVTGNLRRGSRVVHIRNAGSMAHELRVARIKPGATLDEVKRWSRTGGARPVVFVGGVTPLSPGRELQTTLGLQGGDYVVLCALRDRDHHSQTGLLATFRVN